LRPEGLASLLPSVSVRRPVGTSVVLLALLVLSVLAWSRLPLQLLPSGFEPRVLWVRLPLQDASPAEVDELILRPLTDQLATIPGLTEIETRASTSMARATLTFSSDVAMSEAYNDVVDRVERALPDLPDDVDRYFVAKFDPSDEPILWGAVTFGEDLDDPARLIDDVLIPRLERIPGVASVDVFGLSRRAVMVEWDRDRLVAHGVDLGRAQASLQTDNFQLSGGRFVEDGRVVRVRSLATLSDVDALRRYPLPTLADGGPDLRLADIAGIGVGRLASGTIERLDGRQAVAFGVRKESTANTVAVAGAVREALSSLATDPRAAGSAFPIFFDQGDAIEDSTGQLGDALMQGALLSVVVLWVFFRDLRTTLLVSLAIPFSLLLALLGIAALGGTLNLIAMMGLMLAVGMVVDNAIVVVEAIAQRRAGGEGPVEAAVSGTASVALAVTASTLTSMIVFLPVILMTADANVSFFLGELGIPVILSLGASLLVALTFSPLASARLGPQAPVAEPRWVARLADRYAASLTYWMDRPGDVGVVACALLLLTMGVAVPGVQCTPGEEGGPLSFEIALSVPPEATLDERAAIADAYEAALDAVREDNGIDMVHVSIRETGDRGEIQVFLKEDGPATRDEVMAKIRDHLPDDLPGVVASLGRGDGDNGRMRLTLFGEDADVLEPIAEEVARRARTVPGVTGAQPEIESDGRPELRVRPRPDALLASGSTARAVAQTLAFAVRGNQALPPLTLGGDEVDVISRIELADRQDISAVLDFPVVTATGAAPVRALSDVAVARGPGSRGRTDRRLAVHVQLDLASDVDREQLDDDLALAMSDLSLPRGVSLQDDAWRSDQAEQDTATVFALAMSCVFVYLLMGVMFESWLLPLGVLTTIPLAVLGAFWGLYLTDTPLDVMAGLGLVVLVGVVVNNGIVLVDRIAAAREEGLSRHDAILDACRTRLRPILMTAATTILGLVPMAVGTESFIGLPYAPLGRCIMGGMIASSFLTLWWVPMLYVWLDDLSDWVNRAGSQVGRSA
jgi:HAE1 family hydrophobic/amphiphilic exporter-1